MRSLLEVPAYITYLRKTFLCMKYKLPSSSMNFNFKSPQTLKTCTTLFWILSVRGRCSQIHATQYLFSVKACTLAWITTTILINTLIGVFPKWGKGKIMYNFGLYCLTFGTRSDKGGWLKLLTLLMLTRWISLLLLFLQKLFLPMLPGCWLQDLARMENKMESRPVGSVGWESDYRAGGRGFKSRPDLHSGSLNNWGESAAFVMTSANG